MPRQQAHIGDARRAEEQRFEEPPAVLRGAGKINRQLAQDAALPAITNVRHQGAAQFAPAAGLPHVDQTPDSRSAQCQHGMRRTTLEVAEERNRRDARKLTHQRRNARRKWSGTADGDEDRVDGARLQVVDDIVHRITVQGPVASLTSCVDASSLGSGEQGRDGWQIRSASSIVGHGSALPGDGGEARRRALATTA